MALEGRPRCSLPAPSCIQLWQEHSSTSLVHLHLPSALYCVDPHKLCGTQHLDPRHGGRGVMPIGRHRASGIQGRRSHPEGTRLLARPRCLSMAP